jgi:hypothetical protein
LKELDAVAAAIDSLGPILELDRRWRSGAAKTVDEAKALRAEIQEVLDRPRCAYDDAALALYRALSPQDRELIGEEDRRVIRPYCLRSPWLALEEHSEERLRSGLVLLALALPDEDDYRDVMISLAPHRVAADEIGVDASTVFTTAGEFAGPGAAGTIRAFGEHKTSLGAFGWRRLTTPHGERFHLF